MPTKRVTVCSYMCMRVLVTAEFVCRYETIQTDYVSAGNTVSIFADKMLHPYRCINCLLKCLPRAIKIYCIHIL